MAREKSWGEGRVAVGGDNGGEGRACARRGAEDSIEEAESFAVEGVAGSGGRGQTRVHVGVVVLDELGDRGDVFVGDVSRDVSVAEFHEKTASPIQRPFVVRAVGILLQRGLLREQRVQPGEFSDVGVALLFFVPSFLHYFLSPSISYCLREDIIFSNKYCVNNSKESRKLYEKLELKIFNIILKLFVSSCLNFDGSCTDTLKLHQKFSD